MTTALVPQNQPPAIQYPRPRLYLAPDLQAAAEAACKLVVTTQSLVFWLTYGSNTVLLGMNYEDVVGYLPGEVDSQAAQCADATRDIWNELIISGGPFSDPALAACCAHHAALLFAWDVRRQVDTIAQVFVGQLRRGARDGLLSGDELRGHWDQIVAELRRQPVSWFDRLPEGNRITQAIVVEVVRATHARGIGRPDGMTHPKTLAPGTEPRTDFVPLTGWTAIVNALNRALGTRRLRMQGNQLHNLVRALNEDHDGPIVMPKKKGGQPRVDEGRLIAWWQGLTDGFDQRAVERARLAASARATVVDTHPHGRDGEVVPGISGGVKKSRRKR